MKKVFIGGSIKMGRLNDVVRERIQNIINEELGICVGDANGADKAVQKYLAEQDYRNVEVFCTGLKCRNNIGEWQLRQIESARQQRDFEFYTAKDVAMSKEADFGLMLWDGKSVGTLNNVLNLVDRGKKVVVYFAPEKGFITVRSFRDVGLLLMKCASKDVARCEKRLELSNRIPKPQTELPFAT